MDKITYVFDIDGTVCTNTMGVNDYRDAEPLQDRIDKVNELYDRGNTIIFQTARVSRPYLSMHIHRYILTHPNVLARTHVQVLPRWHLPRVLPTFGLCFLHSP